MKRVELTEAVLSGWSRLTATERDRFFGMFLRAALRLEPSLGLKAWLRKRLRNRPLAAPVDMSRLLADADIALLLKAAREAPGESAAGPDRDKADGG